MNMYNKNILFCVLLSIFSQSLSWFEHARAVRALAGGDASTAEELLTSLVTDYPEDPVILYDAGVAAYKKQEYEKANAYFSYALSVGLSDQLMCEQAMFNRGNSLVKMNKLEEAITQYEEVLHRNATNERAKHNLDYVKKLLEQQKNQEESSPKKEKKDQESESSEKKQEQKEQNSSSQEEKNNQKQDDNEPADQQQSSENQKKQSQKNEEAEIDKQEKNEQQNQQNQERSNKKNTQKAEDPNKSKKPEANGLNESSENRKEKTQAEAGASEQEDRDEEKKVELHHALIDVLDEQERQDAVNNKKLLLHSIGAGKSSSQTGGW